MAKLTPAELADAMARTIAHYDHKAAGFWEGTRDHDVSQNYEALLEAIARSGLPDRAASPHRDAESIAEPPFSILDFGCGPGRDLHYFRALGHEAIGLDGSAQFVAMARAYSGCEVWQQDFVALALPAARFDGVFANASLLHVPKQELPRVLGELRDTLVARGVLFCSIPHGPDTEVMSGDRYSAFHSEDAWRRFVTGAGFVELSHYYRPAGKPRSEQPWLATVWRKR